MFYRKYNKLIILFFLVAITIPVFANAVLVPCGGSKTTSTEACTLADLAKLADKVIKFLLLQLAMPLAIVSILIGGILMITSRGDPGQLQRGKDIFYYSVIGFVLAFGAYLIIEVIITTLTGTSSLCVWIDELLGTTSCNYTT